MFTCTCSLKREEGSPFDVQDRVNLKEEYRDVLEGKEDPMQHPPAPSNDSEHFRETYLPAHPEHFNPIGGLHMQKADMTKYNAERNALDRRQLLFYTLRGSLPLPTSPYPPSPGAEKLTLTREALVRIRLQLSLHRTKSSRPRPRLHAHGIPLTQRHLPRRDQRPYHARRAAHQPSEL
jgi:hypothetical protein